LSGVAGNYFFPGSSRFVAATASVTAGRDLVVTDGDSMVLTQAPLRRVRVSPRLGKLARRVQFPDGGQFESTDNDGIDALLQGRLRKGTFVDRIERSLGWILASIATAVVMVALFLVYGIPATALWLANETPPYLSATISREALSEVDTFMKRSKLKQADRNRAGALFRRIATQGKGGPNAYHLLFRDGGPIGANAFSLPDGTVVLTDQIYAMVKRDDELEGVFGHEIAHADRRHALQAVYQASLIPAAIAFATGDVTQVAHIATLLSGILIQTAYSRSLEQQADDDSAQMMNRIGADPAALGELLERMEKKECGKTGCGPSWLGDHPDTAARAAKLRRERSQPK
jgi:Zn-dependent protease with chaperone function